MPVYNPYTNTSDMPIVFDFYPKDERGKIRTFPAVNAQEKDKARRDYRTAMSNWIAKYNIPQSIIDEWNRATENNVNTDDSWWQKIKDKVSNTVSNFVQNAGNVLSNAGESALLAPLLPFKRAMVNALKRKGESVTTSTPLGEVASLFKQKIVDRQASTNYLNHAELDTQQILDLIDKIIPFFTLILEKIKSGTASSDERLIGEDAEEDGKNASTGGQPTSQGVNAPTSSNNWFSQYKYLIIGAAAVVLFLMYKKKK